MAKVNFLLQSKTDNAQIYIRLSISRNLSLKKKTGFSINPKDWSDSGLPKQNSPANKNLSTDLKKLDLFVMDNFNKAQASETLVNSFWLERQIIDCFNRVEKTDSQILVNHISFIIDNANTRKVKIAGGHKIGLSKSTIKNYTLFKKIILEYEAKTKKQILFSEISKPFADKFTNWLINEKDYSTNYAGKQLEILKTVCIDAEKHEIKINPHSKNILHFREADDNRYIQTLSFAELETIRTAEITKPELINARNWLLIGCEIGQRGGDLLELTPDNIRYKGGAMYIDLTQQKTKKAVTIGVINPHVIDILENCFPSKIPHQKLNVLIRKVCEVAKINEKVQGSKLDPATNRKKLDFYSKYELITSHCFRRSFCTNYYKKIPTAVLIGISGHSKESLFLTYINQREDKDANADLFMAFYAELQKAPEMKVVHNTGTE